MVWAQARGGLIGAAGRLPWHLPEDLRAFRELTWGSTVVMGRNTWNSLPATVRPLPGRTNVVLSSRPDWRPDGAQVRTSIVEVLQEFPQLWVIGGASVYAAFLSVATTVVMTEIDADVDGDTWAPTLDQAWHRADRDPAQGWSTSTTGLRYAVSRFERIAPDAR